MHAERVGREKVKTEKKKWRLRDAYWESIQVDLSESGWENEGLLGVNEINEKLTEKVRSVATHQVGGVTVSVRKILNKA